MNFQEWVAQATFKEIKIFKEDFNKLKRDGEIVIDGKCFLKNKTDQVILLPEEVKLFVSDLTIGYETEEDIPIIRIRGYLPPFPEDKTKIESLLKEIGGNYKHSFMYEVILRRVKKE